MSKSRNAKTCVYIVLTSELCSFAAKKKVPYKMRIKICPKNNGTIGKFTSLHSLTALFHNIVKTIPHVKNLVEEKLLKLLPSNTFSLKIAVSTRKFHYACSILSSGKWKVHNRCLPVYSISALNVSNHYKFIFHQVRYCIKIPSIRASIPLELKMKTI